MQCIVVLNTTQEQVHDKTLISKDLVISLIKKLKATLASLASIIGDGYLFSKCLTIEDGKRGVQSWITTNGESGYPDSKLELTFRDISGGA